MLERVWVFKIWPLTLVKKLTYILINEGWCTWTVMAIELSACTFFTSKIIRNVLKGSREKKSHQTKPRKYIELTTAVLQKLKAGKWFEDELRLVIPIKNRNKCSLISSLRMFCCQTEARWYPLHAHRRTPHFLVIAYLMISGGANSIANRQASTWYHKSGKQRLLSVGNLTFGLCGF